MVVFLCFGCSSSANTETPQTMSSFHEENIKAYNDAFVSAFKTYDIPFNEKVRLEKYNRFVIFEPRSYYNVTSFATSQAIEDFVNYFNIPEHVYTNKLRAI